MKLKPIRDMLCTCRYSLLLHFRYPMNWVWLIATPVIYIGLVGWLAGIMGAESFFEYTGGSTDSVLYTAIGYAVFSIANYSWQIAGKIEREMVMGTVKLNMLLPIKPSSYLYGLSLSNLISTGSMAVFILLMSIFASMPTLPRLLQALLFIALSAAYYFGVSLMMASLAMRYKSLSGMGNLLTFVLQILTGLVLPVRALPQVLQALSRLSPTTWAIDSIRSSLLSITPLAPFKSELVIMLCAAAAANLLGQYALRASCRYIRAHGLMDDF